LRLLLHAVGEGAAGDAAVVTALAWSDGEFDFDAKAKLPADETVRSSIPELIERSSVNGSARPQSSSQTTPTKRRSQPASAPAPPPAPSEPAQEAWVPPGQPAPATSPTDAARPAPASQPDGPANQPAQPAGGRVQMTPTGCRPFFTQRPRPPHSREAVPFPPGQAMS